MSANSTQQWSLGLCLLALSAAPPTSQSQRSLKSGGWTIEWSDEAGRATHPRGATIVLWQQPAKEEGCDLSESGNLLSVVGTIVSFERSSSGYCQGWAHPSSESSFKAIDLSREEGSRGLTLYDFFEQTEVDREYQRAWSANPDLREVPEDSCGPTPSVDRFAFHHVVRDKVKLRVSVGQGCTAGGGYTTEMELLLKPRRQLLVALRAADKAGSLMNRLAPFR